MTKHDEWILDQQHPMISLKKWQITIDLIASMYQAPATYIIQTTSRGLQIVVSSDHSISPFAAGQWFSHQDDQFSGKVIESCSCLYVNDATNRQEWRRNALVTEHRINSYMGVPIHWSDGSPFGTLCIIDYAITHYSKIYQELMWQFRNIIEADLLLNNQFLQLLDLSTKDDISNLLNRRGFFAQADKHVQLAQRLNQNIGLMILNLDNVKAINEQHGHRIGDKAISALASAIQDVLRDSDVAGRIGGDEFVVLLITQEEQAMTNLAARIRSELNKKCTGELESLNLYASIGSHFYLTNDITRIDRMVSEIDKAMNENKSYRNQHQQNHQADAG